VNASIVDVLGIDIGGVIIDGVREDGEMRSEPPEVPGAFAAIARLSERRFRQQIWLISRCTSEMEQRLMGWLERRNFFSITGLDRQHVLFCREVRDKATVCRRLNVTHFIDDRLEVLVHLVGLVQHLYRFQSRASEGGPLLVNVDNIHPVKKWSELTDMLLNDGPRATETVVGSPVGPGPPR
jgi:hypothetical protein